MSTVEQHLKQARQLARAIVKGAMQSDGMGMFVYAVYPTEDPDTTAEEDQCYAVDVCEAVAETVGGAGDGQQLVAGFMADISGIHTLLTPPEHLGAGFTFCPTHFHCGLDDCARVTIEGNYKGTPVIVTLFQAPQGQEPSLSVDAESGDVAPRVTVDEDEDEDEAG